MLQTRTMFLGCIVTTLSKIWGGGKGRFLQGQSASRTISFAVRLQARGPRGLCSHLNLAPEQIGCECSDKHTCPKRVAAMTLFTCIWNLLLYGTECIASRYSMLCFMPETTHQGEGLPVSSSMSGPGELTPPKNLLTFLPIVAQPNSFSRVATCMRAETATLYLEKINDIRLHADRNSNSLCNTQRLIDLQFPGRIAGVVKHAQN